MSLIRRSKQKLAHSEIANHFAPISTDNLVIRERKFPFRVRADLQRAIDQLFSKDLSVLHFSGIHSENAHNGLGFAQLLANTAWPAVCVPPQYEEVDIGEDTPLKCLANGLWLLKQGETPFAVLLSPSMYFGNATGIQFQIATTGGGVGEGTPEVFFKHLEDSVRKAQSYRGKVLSLETRNHYSGQSNGISVHRLRTVARDEVILPGKTLDLLDRNVIRFVEQREKLARFRQATKKGLLFYGPPGTGKTHTIHYLAGALKGHTTLLISAEQVGLLSEYMTLARLLAPSIVVIEDADLIARDRTNMQNTCEEVLLNKLLNEMDGLKEDAEILFILTTNRPEALESALSSRPGRIDQAIEFPLPDSIGREKLVRLYSQGAALPPDLMETVVKKTEKVSAAFIKELLRRAFQYRIERTDSGTPELVDFNSALGEMLLDGGSLNMKLLGVDSEASNP